MERDQATTTLEDNNLPGISDTYLPPCKRYFDTKLKYTSNGDLIQNKYKHQITLCHLDNISAGNRLGKQLKKEKRKSCKDFEENWLWIIFLLSFKWTMLHFKNIAWLISCWLVSSGMKTASKRTTFITPMGGSVFPATCRSMKGWRKIFETSRSVTIYIFKR